MSEELSAFLRNELERRRISQRGGAMYAGIGSNTVHYIVNHPESDPLPDTLNAIADGLRIPRVRLYQLAGYLANGVSPDPATHMEYELLEEFRKLHDLEDQRYALAQLEMFVEHSENAQPTIVGDDPDES